MVYLAWNDGLKPKRCLRLILSAAFLLVQPLAPTFATQITNVICSSGHFKIENTSSNSLYNGENASDTRPQITIAHGKTPSSIEIILNGPILGVESSDFKADLACTSDGITVSGTILQNPDYQGAQTASYIWRPIIKVVGILNKTDINITSIWHMPLNSSQSRPITIKKTFNLPANTHLKY